MHVITTEVVEDDWNVVGNRAFKITLLMSSTSVFPSVVTVIPHLFVSQLIAFQTDVATS